MLRLLGVAALLLVCGCVPLDFFQENTDTATVHSSQFAPTGQTAQVKALKLTPSSPTAAITVDRIGQQLLAANKQLGIKPNFMTIGAGDPEIFHQGTTTLYITESLVRQCKSEGQLAAVLSLEMGKMIAERESFVNPADRDPPKALPMQVPIGNAGQFSGMDQIYQAEVAKLDADRRVPARKVAPLTPELLARKYLETAGFDSNELVAVTPVLQAADKNYVLEKQFNPPNTPPMWAPK